MSQADINSVLSQIRNIQAQSQLSPPGFANQQAPAHSNLDNAVARQQNMQNLINDKAYQAGFAGDTRPLNSLPLSELKPVQAQGEVSEVPSFGMMFKRAVDNVNGVQKHAGYMTKQYELGNPNVELSQVMVSTQKAGVAFQAMTEVRNKLVDAYKDIMNMPI